MLRISRSVRAENGVAHAALILVVAALAIVGVIALARQLDAPVGSDIKTHAIMGVDVRNADPGAYVTQVATRSPADGAHIHAGDVVVAIDGTTITTTNDLTRALAADQPGAKVRVGWIDAQKTFKTADVVLEAGPSG
jgi:serine protease Do